MDSCCENKAGELAQLRAKQSRVLYIVLAVNAAMFLVEFIAGWIANSTALLGDSLDMFGDASVYALTLFVLHRSARARAGAALFKGGFMLLFGMLVVADALRKLVLQEVPAADWMGIIGALALLANGYCFMLLYRHRSDDLNMRSTWLCSRNDLVANSSVIAAAGLVALTNSLWPDILVGMAIAALFLHSAGQVFREAWVEWRANAPQPQQPEPAPACAGAAQGKSSSCCAPSPQGLVGIAEPSLSAAQFTPVQSCCAGEPQTTSGACCAPPSPGAAEPSESPSIKGCCSPKRES
ncbi:cation diffusion facilitator family transporter [Pseudomonas stutzeri]|jgi:cation diffusion facilitator family transporter|uniref:cation transporter n=1 Tax=Stutzerimonas TaxID=2901164 RepID=UPI001E0CA85A|nr:MULTISPECIES: cation diffusion facilitator family transporter [Stutzerimonas]MBW8336479.1 cation diffusion facilitator family transporter [Pseudomonas sp.]MBW8453230.1 cation diffusion facilitator family transporter [Pseudomonas sp.]MCC8344874.1 cation diffusion facilitator family transporter [Stutzerimonas stutzeri]